MVWLYTGPRVGLKADELNAFEMKGLRRILRIEMDIEKDKGMGADDSRQSKRDIRDGEKSKINIIRAYC